MNKNNINCAYEGLEVYAVHFQVLYRSAELCTRKPECPGLFTLHEETVPMVV